ncbi:aminoglycoside phosphotransferase family protein [Candidatus Bathyarchaeota archaeon]|nr:aminoglycoside phosphotransferase family protein [Candidatus Brockarchaeota archaeon]MBS7618452.1 aminoglycoside phosphotransferase family protein [Candidatus Bathyarchaeota archaeon]
MVFRTPKRSDRLHGELYDEIRLLKYLKNRVDIGIPDYTYVLKDGTAAGYRLLRGQELKPSRFKRLARPEKEMIAEQIASFLTVLHTMPKSVIKKCHLRTENHVDHYIKLVHDTRRLVFPRLSNPEVKIIEQYFVQLKAALSHRHRNVLVHNDLTWEHILWDRKKQKVSIIDFSDRALGDPAVDFAGLHEYGLDFVKRVLSLYGCEKDEHMLYRSQLYFKRISLFIMNDALKGWSCTFKEGYKMFKEYFKLKPAMHKV